MEVLGIHELSPLGAWVRSASRRRKQRTANGPDERGIEGPATASPPTSTDPASVPLRCEPIRRIDSITAAAATTAAATTAAVAAATATAAAATTAVAATTTTATAAIFAGLGFVDGETPSIMIVVVKTFDRRLRLGFRVHLHEAEPLRAIRVPIDDDLRALHGPELREQAFKVGLVHAVGEVAHVQLLAQDQTPERKGERLSTRRILSRVEEEKGAPVEAHSAGKARETNIRRAVRGRRKRELGRRTNQLGPYQISEKNSDSSVFGILVFFFLSWYGSPRRSRQRGGS